MLHTLLFLWVHRRCWEEDKTTVYFQSGPRAVWPIITCISMISLSFASPGGSAAALTVSISLSNCCPQARKHLPAYHVGFYRGNADEKETAKLQHAEVTFA